MNNYVKFGAEPVLPYAIEEAVNRLRINISFLGSEVKKIMIVSSEPNEGKSFVAMNLWKQMALSGEKSILVDMDMRKSTMKSVYALSREDGRELRGTSHFLAGNNEILDVVMHTDIPGGDLLPNVDNIVNPSMLLESRKLDFMMKFMEINYRYVFLDVPPLGLVSCRASGEQVRWSDPLCTLRGNAPVRCPKLPQATAACRLSGAGDRSEPGGGHPGGILPQVLREPLLLRFQGSIVSLDILSGVAIYILFKKGGEITDGQEYRTKGTLHDSGTVPGSGNSSNGICSRQSEQESDS